MCRQLVVERDSLKGEVMSLRSRLSQYEDVDAQENMAPAMPLLEGVLLLAESLLHRRKPVHGIWQREALLQVQRIGMYV